MSVGSISKHGSNSNTLKSIKRTPSWTDRILYATHTDSPDTPEKSNITSLLYTSIPSYTTSDHVRLMLVFLLLYLISPSETHRMFTPPPSPRTVLVYEDATGPTPSASLHPRPRLVPRTKTADGPRSRPYPRADMVAPRVIRRRFCRRRHIQLRAQHQCMGLVEASACFWLCAIIRLVL